MSKVLVWIGAIFAPIGLVFAGFRAWAYLEDRSLAESGVRAQGTVIDMVASRESDNGYTYRPMVEFFDASGERHTFTSLVGRNPPGHSTGETVEVIYAPGAPQRAMLDSSPAASSCRDFRRPRHGLRRDRRRPVVRLVSPSRDHCAPARQRSADPGEIPCVLPRHQRASERAQPFRVVCQATHPGTGKLQSFKSDPIWIDVTDRLAGGEVRVFVDPARPRHHWVDLSPIVDESDMGWGRVGHRTRNATSRNWTK